jgi:glycosyltransferase involved in cell wall biosynthesis
MIPRLSIVIPVRNGIDFIERAVDSARAVPVDRLEIIVVDDGSTDGTSALLSELAVKDPRIVVVTRTSDHGVSGARNAGIARASAAIVCFLDADDILRPQAIARRLRFHTVHPDIVFSFSDYQTLLPDGTIEARAAEYHPRFERFLAGRVGILPLGDMAFPLLYGENPVCTSGTMARREVLIELGCFSRELRQAEDWDMWIRLSRAGAVAYSTATELLHTARPGSLSTDVRDRTWHIAEVARRHRAYALRRHPGAAVAAASFIAVAQAEQARGLDRNVAALGHYLAGFALQPSLGLMREALRATAVVAGLKSGRIPTLQDRARDAARCCPAAGPLTGEGK